MAKGQRKQAREKIDKRQFEQLCGIQCTEEEIMAVFDVSKDTLIRWCKDTYGTDFATIFKEKRRYGCASLRRNQWRLAEESRMDSSVVLRPDGRLDVVENRNIRKGDLVALGRSEDGHEGIYVHTKGFEDEESAIDDQFVFRHL